MLLLDGVPFEKKEQIKMQKEYEDTLEDLIIDVASLCCEEYDLQRRYVCKTCRDLNGSLYLITFVPWSCRSISLTLSVPSTTRALMTKQFAIRPSMLGNLFEPCRPALGEQKVRLRNPQLLHFLLRFHNFLGYDLIDEKPSRLFP